MAAPLSYFDRKSSSTIRPGADGAPLSPHTPQRTISSTFSSPGGNYRGEEDCVVFEVGSRYLRAGFAGESSPRCTLSFGPEESSRVGDYRRWLPARDKRRAAKKKKKLASRWGRDHELWRLDLRDEDIGLVEDKLERAIREAYSRYLLLDSKSRRVLLVLPSLLPYSLLSVLLFTVFNSFQVPGVTLLPTPTLSVAAAGLRSGLVADIGWHETVVTAVYDFREVYHGRTTRAMRLATIETAKLLAQLASPAGSSSSQAEEPEKECLGADFDHAEEVLCRVGWCRPEAQAESGTSSEVHVPEGADNLRIAEDGEESEDGQRSSLLVPLSPHSTLCTAVPFASLSIPIENAIFARDQPRNFLDDNEQTIPHQLYKALLALPPDVRGICMSHIVFTGGGANIPGLKSRLLDELRRSVQGQGFDPVQGAAADERRRRLKDIDHNRQAAVARSSEAGETAEDTASSGADAEIRASAAFVRPVPDPIDENLRREEAKVGKPVVIGVVRGVETLGAWAGASLTAGLKVKGVVDVEREMFLQHGLAGAKKEVDVSALKAKQGQGAAGLTRTGGTEGMVWTLGAWA